MKPLDAGQNAQIFDVQEVAKNDVDESPKTDEFVLKISEDYESMAHEIKVLKLVKRLVEKSKDPHNMPFPKLKDYGTFIGYNLDPSDIKPD